MDTYLNRSVLTIIPQKPFYDWINYLEPEFPMSDDGDYRTYLLFDDLNTEDAEVYVKTNYMLFFEDHLYGMWTDENAWPQDRSYAVFSQWFTWKFASIVKDMEDDTPLFIEQF